MTNWIAEARDYVNFGQHIIPVSRDKIPLIKKWTTHQPKLREFPTGCRISQVMGRQPNGEFHIGPEFDHRPADGIDATKSYELFRNRISDALFNKLWITRSTSGLGYHIRAISPRPIPGSIVRDDKGKKIGDLRSTGGHLVIQEEDKWLSGAPWTMQTLTEDELDQLLAALNYRQPATPGNTILDWPDVDRWLKDIDQLLSNGIPHRFSPTCQGANYLRHTIPARRTSEIRYALIEEMISYGYDDSQVAALALTVADLGASQRKGLTWLEKDIERIISKVHAAGPRKRRNGNASIRPSWRSKRPAANNTSRTSALTCSG